MLAEENVPTCVKNRPIITGQENAPMRIASTVVFTLLSCAASYAQSVNPLSDGARMHYGNIRGFVTRAAAKMPEELYAFRPTPEVRTFAQLVGHLADANYRLCSVMEGQNPPRDAGVEKTVSAKPELVKALADSFAYCDTQFAAMTDQAGTPMVKFDAGGEGRECRSRCPASLSWPSTRPMRSSTTETW
jgi:hypothetical protein